MRTTTAALCHGSLRRSRKQRCASWTTSCCATWASALHWAVDGPWYPGPWIWRQMVSIQKTIMSSASNVWSKEVWMWNFRVTDFENVVELSESLNVWKLGCLNVWMSESLSVSKFECLKVWMSESLDGWKFECLDVWKCDWAIGISRKSRTKASFSYFNPWNLKEVLHEMRFCEIADARNRVFKRASDDVWGSLSGGRVRNTLAYRGGSWSDRPCSGAASSGIVLSTFLHVVPSSWFATHSRSRSQWNWLLRRRFGDVLARSSIVLCKSVSADRGRTDSSWVSLPTSLRVFCNSVCADHIVGCVKVAWHRGCVRNTIVFWSWTF